MKAHFLAYGLSLLLAFGAAPDASAQAPRPASGSVLREAAILLRVLSYERTFPERVGGNLTVGIVYAQDSATSTTEAAAWKAAFLALADVRVNGMSAATVDLGLGAERTLASVEEHDVDLLVVCAGLGDDKWRSVLQAARHQRVLTASASAADARAQRTTLSVVADGNQHRMLVNLNVANEQRIRFSSQLLKLADLIQ